jgi:DNA-binding transcriptional regulator LsrR (DeoR family)
MRVAKCHEKIANAVKPGSDIRHLVAVEGLSQRAIARKLGISRNTVKFIFVWG